MIDAKATEFLHIYNEILYTSEFTGDKPINLIGKYEKKILIVLNKSDFTTEQEELLMKMLQACKITSQDYGILLREDETPVIHFVRHFTPEVLIVFGMTLDLPHMRLNKPLNKPFRFNQIKMLLSYSLQELQANTTFKSDLWSNGLKPLFGLS